LILNFSSEIEAADVERRIIAGVVVPFNKVGYTSVGPVIFESGSIKIEDTAKIKLLAQHDPTNPIGRAQSFQTSDQQITGTFKVSSSATGQDFLIRASEGLIASLSIGVEVIASKPSKDGTLYVQSAVMKEVSLVESPAFADAVVTKVAASNEAAEESNQPTESESVVTTAPIEETPVEATEEAPVVEAAARPTVKASAPYITSSVRTPIQSMGGYALHSIKAKLGDEDSALYVRAAADSTSTNPAFNPTQYLTEFISNTNFGRAAIDACGKAALPNSGFTINVPSLITPGQDAPTVAATAESAAPSNTGMTSAYQSYTVSKYAGQQTVSLELIDRSSDNPLFMDQLMLQLERAYMKATDAAVIAALISGGTAATATANSAAGLISFLSTESAAAYAGTSYFAKNVVIGSGTWAAAMGYTDSTGRPIFQTTIPGSSGYNAAGSVGSSTLRGNLLGLDSYVDVYAASTAGADNSAFVIAPEAVTIFESPTAMFSVNVVSSMSVNLAIYGYMAPAILQAKGVRKYKTV
jgi:HK97 family phage prohead protease/HK97 family phage major capsid protein